ncbi:hypothetical protein ACFW9L_16140 [Streptomyces sp. NPDC059517]|uniref:hypothetical protein n=1 Tax=Streptomyces sp. NPDC059517 TaxID=3346855 RepID=UPI0036B9FBFD
MIENTDSIVTSIPNVKVQAVAERVLRQFQLTAYKVAAHHGAPSRFPLPTDSTATEHLLAARFKMLNDAQKKQAMDRVATSLKDSAGRARQFSDLAKINLASATPIESLVRGLPLPQRLKFPASELGKVSAVAVKENVSAAAAVPLKKLALRIHSVKCVDETGEWGEDEIYLGGTSVDESGDTGKISAFKVGDFNDGGLRRYMPPRQFTWFDLVEGSVKFPRSYFVTLVLAEVDWGGFAKFLNALLSTIQEQVTKAIAIAIGTVIGQRGGVVGRIIEEAVHWTLSKLFDYLRSLWSDDVFKPVTARVVVPSTTSRWASKNISPERTVQYVGHGGAYRLTYDWHMFI